MEGLNPDVAKLYPSVATPVCRDTKPLSPLATWDHSETWPIPSVSEAAVSAGRSPPTACL